MCDATRLIPIPEHLWKNNAVYSFDPEHPEYGLDEEGRRCLALDACIVPAVQQLWQAGIVTLSCCCGHGDPWGVITIQTQAGVGQRGAMVLRADRYDELNAIATAARAYREACQRGRYRLENEPEARAALFAVIDGAATSGEGETGE